MLQFASQKEAEEASAPQAANGISSDSAAAAADGEGEAGVDAEGKPVSSEMASMLAVDSKRAATAAIRAQVRWGGVEGTMFMVWGSGVKACVL
jgi:hypothetical protein